jgi:hypothetical protein
MTTLRLLWTGVPALACAWCPGRMPMLVVLAACASGVSCGERWKQAEDDQQALIRQMFHLISKRPDSACNFVEGSRCVPVSTPAVAGSHVHRAGSRTPSLVVLLPFLVLLRGVSAIGRCLALGGANGTADVCGVVHANEAVVTSRLPLPLARKCHHCS